MHSFIERAIALLLVHAILVGTQVVLFAQQVERQPLISNYFDAANGTPVEQLVQTALVRNAGLLAARQRIAEALGLLRQSGFRTNPSIDASVGNGRILGSAGEREISLGYNHVFELGGKRERRVEVSEIGVQLAQFAALKSWTNNFSSTRKRSESREPAFSKGRHRHLIKD
jgi:outer membrane protein TolC